MHLLGLYLFPFFFFPFFGFGFVMYFLPTLIAFVREKRDKGPILLVNFLLGWSVIGWVVCLVWALRADPVVYVRS